MITNDLNQTNSKAVSTIVFIFFVILASSYVSYATANEPKPSVDMTSLFKAKMYPTGYFSMLELDTMFVPQGSEIKIELRTNSGEVIQAFEPYSTTPIATENVFSRYRLKSNSNDKLIKGDYVMDVNINGTSATQLAFSVYQESSSDPFASNQKVHFDGDWQKLAYLRFVKSRNFTDDVDYQTMNLRMWSGLSDLAEGDRSDQVTATLKQDGKVLGYSKKSSGSLTANSELNRLDLIIFKPHDRNNEANVLAISEGDLVSGNHTYELTVERQSDGHVLRDFSFQSKNGALVPLARSEFGHSPQHEYLAPRAMVFGTNNYEFETVYWLEENNR